MNGMKRISWENVIIIAIQSFTEFVSLFGLVEIPENCFLIFHSIFWIKNQCFVVCLRNYDVKLEENPTLYGANILRCNHKIYIEFKFEVKQVCLSNERKKWNRTKCVCVCVCVEEYSYFHCEWKSFHLEIDIYVFSFSLEKLEARRTIETKCSKTQPK